MSFLTNIAGVVTRNAGRAGLLLQKSSPTILTGLGIVGVIGTVVLASRAGVKAQPLVQDLSIELDDCDAYADTHGENMLPGKIRVIGNYTSKLAKVYLPTVATAAVTIGCFSGAHGIMLKRNTALVGAFTSLSAAFDRYKKNVEGVLGKSEAHVLQGGGYEDVESVDEDGKKVVKSVPVLEDGAILSAVSIYARFFDESSPRWCKTPEYNLMFLNSVQSRMNDKLKARGHLFLNEVYEELGIPHSQAGQLVGWIYNDEKKSGDGYVDFGFHRIDNDAARDFVNGYERSVLLDFNVDGVVYDLI